MPNVNTSEANVIEDLPLHHRRHLPLCMLQVQENSIQAYRQLLSIILGGFSVK